MIKRPEFKMNQKGTILHWILFAAVIGITLFFILFSSTTTLGKQAEWQLEFLDQNYVPAEEKRISEETKARQIGREVVFFLAEHGGFKEKSPCGEVGGVSVWGKGCWPQVEENAAKLAEERMEKYSNFKFEKNQFSASGKKDEISTPKGKYSFDTSFHVDLGYSFEEYETIYRESLLLLEDCRDQRDLPACVQENKAGTWELGDCTGKSAEGRVLPFCVASPRQTKIYSREGKPVLVKYQLALDFDPGHALAVEKTSLTRENGNFDLSFPLDPEAERYNLYYTWFAQFQFHPGPAEEVFKGLTSWGVHEVKREEIKDGCEPAEAREVNTAYLCGDVVAYLLQDGRLNQDQENFFSVAVVKQGEESPLEEMIKT